MLRNIPDEIQNALQNGAHLLINLSAGKDSHAMTLAIKQMRLPNPMTLIHANVGRWEWKQTGQVCREIAVDAEIPLFVVKNDHRDLHEAVIKRTVDRPDAPPFPSSAARYCTSDYKRAPIQKWTRNHLTGTIINCIGFRADESSARSKRGYWKQNEQLTLKDGSRNVLDWHPIFDWTTEEVWWQLGYTLDELKQLEIQTRSLMAAGFSLDYCRQVLRFKPHPAYLLGNQRVSCVLCVLASKNDLENGAAQDPELLEELVGIEERSGFTFRKGYSLKETEAWQKRNASPLITGDKSSNLAGGHSS